MPLETKLLSRGGKERRVVWSWEDRLILASFVLDDGGTVGQIKPPDGDRSWLGMGYIGAGCDHTFTQEFGYCQVDTGRVIQILPGMRYREYRV